jgi:mono/diheme cytochrome c family protein
MKLKVIGGIGTVIVLLSTGMLISCQSDEQIEFNRYYSLGNLIYQGHCQNCHGAQGEGLRGLIPPLNDSAYLKVNKANLACLVKNGLKGKITVKNRLFEGEMLPVDLPPVEVAEVLTYINNSFGNKTGTVTARQVELDLNNCR